MQVGTTIDSEGDSGMVVKRLSVPMGLEELMESLTKQILLKKPKDIYTFASDYFAHLLALREQGTLLDANLAKSSQTLRKQTSKEKSEAEELNAIKVKSLTTVTKYNKLPTPIIFTNSKTSSSRVTPKAFASNPNRVSRYHSEASPRSEKSKISYEKHKRSSSSDASEKIYPIDVKRRGRAGKSKWSKEEENPSMPLSNRSVDSKVSTTHSDNIKDGTERRWKPTHRGKRAAIKKNDETQEVQEESKPVDSKTKSSESPTKERISRRSKLATQKLNESKQQSSDSKSSADDKKKYKPRSNSKLKSKSIESSASQKSSLEESNIVVQGGPVPTVSPTKSRAKRISRNSEKVKKTAVLAAVPIATAAAVGGITSLAKSSKKKKTPISGSTESMISKSINNVKSQDDAEISVDTDANDLENATVKTEITIEGIGESLVGISDDVQDVNDGSIATAESIADTIGVDELDHAADKATIDIVEINADESNHAKHLDDSSITTAENIADKVEADLDNTVPNAESIPDNLDVEDIGNTVDKVENTDIDTNLVEDTNVIASTMGETPEDIIQTNDLDTEVSELTIIENNPIEPTNSTDILSLDNQLENEDLESIDDFDKQSIRSHNLNFINDGVLVENNDAPIRNVLLNDVEIFENDMIKNDSLGDSQAKAAIQDEITAEELDAVNKTNEIIEDNVETINNMDETIKEILLTDAKENEIFEENEKIKDILLSETTSQDIEGTHENNDNMNEINELVDSSLTLDHLGRNFESVEDKKSEADICQVDDEKTSREHNENFLDYEKENYDTNQANTMEIIIQNENGEATDIQEVNTNTNITELLSKFDDEGPLKIEDLSKYLNEQEKSASEAMVTDEAIETNLDSMGEKKIEIQEAMPFKITDIGKELMEQENLNEENQEVANVEDAVKIADESIADNLENIEEQHERLPFKITDIGKELMEQENVNEGTHEIENAEDAVKIADDNITDNLNNTVEQQERLPFKITDVGKELIEKENVNEKNQEVENVEDAVKIVDENIADNLKNTVELQEGLPFKITDVGKELMEKENVNEENQEVENVEDAVKIVDENIADNLENTVEHQERLPFKISDVGKELMEKENVNEENQEVENDEDSIKIADDSIADNLENTVELQERLPFKITDVGKELIEKENVNEENQEVEHVEDAVKIVDENIEDNLENIVEPQERLPFKITDVGKELMEQENLNEVNHEVENMENDEKNADMSITDHLDSTVELQEKLPFKITDVAKELLEQENDENHEVENIEGAVKIADERSITDNLENNVELQERMPFKITDVGKELVEQENLNEENQEEENVKGAVKIADKSITVNLKNTVDLQEKVPFKITDVAKEEENIIEENQEEESIKDAVKIADESIRDNLENTIELQERLPFKITDVGKELMEQENVVEEIKEVKNVEGAEKIADANIVDNLENNLELQERLPFKITDAGKELMEEENVNEETHKVENVEGSRKIADENIVDNLQKNVELQERMPFKITDAAKELMEQENVNEENEVENMEGTVKIADESIADHSENVELQETKPFKITDVGKELMEQENVNEENHETKNNEGAVKLIEQQNVGNMEGQQENTLLGAVKITDDGITDNSENVVEENKLNTSEVRNNFDSSKLRDELSEASVLKKHKAVKVLYNPHILRNEIRAASKDGTDGEKVELNHEIDNEKNDLQQEVELLDSIEATKRFMETAQRLYELSPEKLPVENNIEDISTQEATKASVEEIDNNIQLAEKQEEDKLTNNIESAIHIEDKIVVKNVSDEIDHAHEEHEDDVNVDQTQHKMEDLKELVKDKTSSVENEVANLVEDVEILKDNAQKLVDESIMEKEITKQDEEIDAQKHISQDTIDDVPQTDNLIDNSIHSIADLEGASEDLKNPVNEDTNLFGQSVKPNVPKHEKIAIFPKENAATKIQSFWRGHKSRKDFRQGQLKKMQQPAECDELPHQRGLKGDDTIKAAIVIQAFMRGYLVRRELKRGNVDDIEKDNSLVTLREEEEVDDTADLKEDIALENTNEGILESNDIDKNEDVPDNVETNSTELLKDNVDQAILSDQEVSDALKILDDLPIPSDEPEQARSKRSIEDEFPIKVMTKSVTVDEPEIKPEAYPKLTRSTTFDMKLNEIGNELKNEEEDSPESVAVATENIFKDLHQMNDEYDPNIDQFDPSKLNKETEEVGDISKLDSVDTTEVKDAEKETENNDVAEVLDTEKIPIDISSITRSFMENELSNYDSSSILNDSDMHGKNTINEDEDDLLSGSKTADDIDDKTTIMGGITGAMADVKSYFKDKTSSVKQKLSGKSTNLDEKIEIEGSKSEIEAEVPNKSVAINESIEDRIKAVNLNDIEVDPHSEIDFLSMTRSFVENEKNNYQDSIPIIAKNDQENDEKPSKKLSILGGISSAIAGATTYIKDKASSTKYASENSVDKPDRKDFDTIETNLQNSNNGIDMTEDKKDTVMSNISNKMSGVKKYFKDKTSSTKEKAAYSVEDTENNMNKIENDSLANVEVKIDDIDNNLKAFEEHIEEGIDKLEDKNDALDAKANLEKSTNSAKLDVSNEIEESLDEKQNILRNTKTQIDKDADIIETIEQNIEDGTDQIKERKKSVLGNISSKMSDFKQYFKDKTSPSKEKITHEIGDTTKTFDETDHIICDTGITLNEDTNPDIKEDIDNKNSIIDGLSGKMSEAKKDFEDKTKKNVSDLKVILDHVDPKVIATEDCEESVQGKDNIGKENASGIIDKEANDILDDVDHIKDAIIKDIDDTRKGVQLSLNDVIVKDSQSIDSKVAESITSDPNNEDDKRDKSTNLEDGTTYEEAPTRPATYDFRSTNNIPSIATDKLSDVENKNSMIALQEDFLSNEVNSYGKITPVPLEISKLLDNVDSSETNLVDREVSRDSTNSVDSAATVVLNDNYDEFGSTENINDEESNDTEGESELTTVRDKKHDIENTKINADMETNQNVDKNLIVGENLAQHDLKMNTVNLIALQKDFLCNEVNNYGTISPTPLEIINSNADPNSIVGEIIETDYHDDYLIIETTGFDNFENEKVRRSSLKFVANVITAATKIQSIYRGYSVRNKKNKKKVSIGPEIVITENNNELNEEDMDKNEIFSNVIAKIEAEQNMELEKIINATFDTKHEESDLVELRNQENLNYIDNNELNQLSVTLAALKIQKLFKGYKVRQQMKNLKNEQNEITLNNNEIDSEMLKLILDKNEDNTDKSMANMVHAAMIIQKAFKDYKVRNMLNEDISEEKENSAATVIQKSFKGYKVRKDLRNSKLIDEQNSNFSNMTNAAIVIQKYFKGFRLRRSLAENHMKGTNMLKEEPKICEENRNEAATVIQKSFKGFKVRKDIKNAKLRENENTNFVNMTNAAVTIQKYFKGYKLRSSLLKKQNENMKLKSENLTNDAAVTIQKNYKGYKTRKDLKQLNLENKLMELTLAAIKIQRAYTRFKVRKGLKHNKESIVLSPPISIEDKLYSGKKEIAIAKSIDNLLETKLSEKEEIKSKTNEMQLDMASAALIIQKAYKRFRVRKSFKENKLINTKRKAEINNLEYNVPNAIQAAIAIQSAFKGFKVRKAIKKEKKLQHVDESIAHLDYLPNAVQAAIKIQSVFKGYKTRKAMKEGKLVETKNGENVAPTTEEPCIDNLDNKGPNPLQAAIRIQSIFRGFKIRKRIKEAKLEEKKDFDNVATTIEEVCNDNLDYNVPNAIEAAIRIQSMFKGFKTRKAMKEGTLLAKKNIAPTTEEVRNDNLDYNMPNVVEAAIKIQSVFKGFKVRKTIKENENRSKIEEEANTNNLDCNLPNAIEASIKIQSAYKGYMTRKELKEKQLSTIAEDELDDMNDIKLQVEETPNSLSSDYKGEDIEEHAVQNEERKEDNFTSRDKILEDKDTHLGNDHMKDDDDVPQGTVGSLENLAATKIQKVYRGHRVRRNIHEIENDVDCNVPNAVEASIKIQSAYKGYKVRKDMKNNKLKTEQDELDNVSQIITETTDTASKDSSHLNKEAVDKEESDAKKTNNIQDTLKTEQDEFDNVPHIKIDAADTTTSLGNLGNDHIEDNDDVPQGTVQGVEDLAATKIQKTYRRHTVRRSLEEKDNDLDCNVPNAVEASIKIQSAYKGYKVRKNIKDNKLKTEQDELGNVPQIITETADTASVDSSHSNNETEDNEESDAKNTIIIPDILIDDKDDISNDDLSNEAVDHEESDVNNTNNTQDTLIHDKEDASNDDAMQDANIVLTKRDTNKWPFLSLEDLAAIRIQKVYKGYRVRRHLRVDEVLQVLRESKRRQSELNEGEIELPKWKKSDDLSMKESVKTNEGNIVGSSSDFNLKITDSDQGRINENTESEGNLENKGGVVYEEIELPKWKINEKDETKENNEIATNMEEQPLFEQMELRTTENINEDHKKNKANLQDSVVHSKMGVDDACSAIGEEIELPKWGQNLKESESILEENNKSIAKAKQKNVELPNKIVINVDDLANTILATIKIQRYFRQYLTRQKGDSKSKLIGLNVEGKTLDSVDSKKDDTSKNMDETIVDNDIEKSIDVLSNSDNNIKETSDNQNLNSKDNVDINKTVHDTNKNKNKLNMSNLTAAIRIQRYFKQYRARKEINNDDDASEKLNPSESSMNNDDQNNSITNATLNIDYSANSEQSIPVHSGVKEYIESLLDPQINDKTEMHRINKDREANETENLDIKNEILAENTKDTLQILVEIDGIDADNANKIIETANNGQHSLTDANLAAIKIQKNYKGFRARRDTNVKINSNDTAIVDSIIKSLDNSQETIRNKNLAKLKEKSEEIEQKVKSSIEDLENLSNEIDASSEKHEPFFLHAQNTIKDNPIAAAIRVSSRNTSQEPNIGLLHSGEIHDATFPLSFSPTNIQVLVQDHRSTSSRSSGPQSAPTLIHSSEMHDAIIQPNTASGAPAGATTVTSAGVSREKHDDVAQSQAASDNKDSSARRTRAAAGGGSVLGMDAERHNAAIQHNKSEKNMESQAATRIQASFRGYQVRKQMKPKNADITTPRRSSRRKSTGKLVDSNKPKHDKKGNELEERSATKIQAGIRGFLVRRRHQNKTNKKDTPESS